jgi:hypothetical protein
LDRGGVAALFGVVGLDDDRFEVVVAHRLFEPESAGWMGEDEVVIPVF